MEVASWKMPCTDGEKLMFVFVFRRRYDVIDGDWNEFMGGVICFEFV